MKKIPMLEKFAAQSLVEYDGELIFSKEKFAELIVQECSAFVYNYPEKYLTRNQAREISMSMEEHFGVEE
jgi:hypothetical protein